MTSQLTAIPTPEERELRRKQDELAKAQDALAEAELELATVKGRLSSFEQRYLRAVGVHLAELDDIEAQIAETEARKRPRDAAAAERATTRRERARESAAATASLSVSDARFQPSDSLKRLFREIAKRVHPDLALDDEERRRRVVLMAEANVAYAAGDEARLRAILEEWVNDPLSVKGDGVGAELVRVIRRIAQVEKRARKITEQLENLRRAELYELMTSVERQEEDGGNPLGALASGAKGRVASARERLRQCEAAAQERA